MENSNDILMHHGTLGQKWGRRRYQYEDGSLTPEGRERYGVGAPRTGLAGKIDEYRRKRLQAKVERETQKRVAAQQKLKAAEADTDTKLQKDRLKNKAMVEEEIAKRQAAEEQLAAAKANAKAATAEANAEKAKAEAASTKRNAKIDAIKDSIQRLTAGKSPEETEAKVQAKIAKLQLKQAKAEQKLQKEKIKEEIRKIKEARKAEKEQKKNPPPKPVDINSATKFGFDSYEELYSNRHKLTDSEFRAAKNRLDDEYKIYDCIVKNQKAAHDAKWKTANAIKDTTLKTVGKVMTTAVKNPGVAAAAVSMGYGAYKVAVKGKDTPKAEAAVKTIISLLQLGANVATGFKTNDKKKNKDDDED